LEVAVADVTQTVKAFSLVAVSPFTRPEKLASRTGKVPPYVITSLLAVTWSGGVFTLTSTGFEVEPVNWPSPE